MSFCHCSQTNNAGRQTNTPILTFVQQLFFDFFLSKVIFYICPLWTCFSELDSKQLRHTTIISQYEYIHLIKKLMQTYFTEQLTDAQMQSCFHEASKLWFCPAFWTRDMIFISRWCLLVILWGRLFQTSLYQPLGVKLQSSQTDMTLIML